MRVLRWFAAALVVAGVVGAAAVWWGGESRAFSVPGTYATLGAALADVPDGSTIRLEPGTYHEHVTVRRPVTIDGREGAHLVGVPGEPVITIVDTTNVAIRGLTVSGGMVGILVHNADEVAVIGNVVTGNELRGIRIVHGSARVEDNVIRDTWSPYGKGIHVANAHERAETVVAGNVVEGSGSEGIIANMARVAIVSNTVRDNGGDGIAVNEMSTGVVEENFVSGNGGAGVVVLDMADALVVGNSVSVRGADDRRRAPIWLDFHATATLRDNLIEGSDECPIGLGIGSVVTGADNELVAGSPTCAGPLGGLFGSSE